MRTDIIIHYAKIAALVLILIIGLFFKQHFFIILAVVVVLVGYEWYELNKSLKEFE